MPIRMTQALAFVVTGLGLVWTSPACRDVIDLPDQGAQERLRVFKSSATIQLARVDDDLRRLKSHLPDAGHPVQTREAEALAERRRRIGTRLEQLAIDGRSRWDEIKVELDGQITALTPDLDTALHELEGRR
jgi:hypothetical protein